MSNYRKRGIISDADGAEGYELTEKGIEVYGSSIKKGPAPTGPSDQPGVPHEAQEQGELHAIGNNRAVASSH